MVYLIMLGSFVFGATEVVIPGVWIWDGMDRFKGFLLAEHWDFTRLLYGSMRLNEEIYGNITKFGV